MDLKKYYLSPTIFFAIGLILIAAVDYGIRLARKIEYSLGLPEPIWFSLQLIVLAVATITFWKSTSTEKLNSRLIYSLPQLALFLIFYILIIYGYVLGTSIDSF